MLLPDLEQGVRAMIGFILSNQQAQRRRSPVIRQPCCCRRICIVIQMSEYLLNNYRVFNAGNYLDETCAIATFISLLEGPQLAGSSYWRCLISSFLNSCFCSKSGLSHQSIVYSSFRPKADLRKSVKKRAARTTRLR
jgi:hypothetical protein